MKKDIILEKLKALEAEEKQKISGLKAKFEAKRKKLTNGFLADYCESYGNYIAMRGKTLEKKWKKKAGCNCYSPKSEWKEVTIEDWEHRQTSTDAGYGDCDGFRMSLVKTHYLMCPKCKHLIYQKHEVLQEGPEVCRCESEEAHRAADIRPENYAEVYPIIKIGEK